KGWIMAGAITAALLLAFIFGYLVQGTSLEWVSPYIDPVILAVVCVVIIPLPISTIRQALADIFLVTPADLKEHVDEVAKAFKEKHGLLSYRAYVARMGRCREIEIYFIVPPDAPSRTIQEWDALREEVGEMIGDKGPDRWLTVVFTGDPEWAECAPLPLPAEPAIDADHAVPDSAEQAGKQPGDDKGDQRKNGHRDQQIAAADKASPECQLPVDP